MPGKKADCCLILRQTVLPEEAGCAPTAWQAVFGVIVIQNIEVPLLLLSRPLALKRPVIGLQGDDAESLSGRRDSNLRQPAWKAEASKHPAKSFCIGPTSRWTHCSPCLELHWYKMSRDILTSPAKNVTRFFAPFGKRCCTFFVPSGKRCQ